MTRFFGRLLAGMVLAGTLLAAGAQAQAPTPQQLEMFRQLPQSEQQRLLREMRPQQEQQDLSRNAGDARAFEEPRESGGQSLAERATPKPILDEATGLPLFGYDLFQGVPSTFAPVTDVPVPVDYVLGPGDVLNVHLFGNQSGTYQLYVDRDGSITLPQLGPVTVAGMTFDHVREFIRERVNQQMIGVSVNVTLSELRSIRVFVLGEALRPGSYTVSSLSTITNALFASGGVKPIGSLRNIQLKRNGELVTTLDLYDLLLRGDTRSDVRVLPGDVIFIPPVGTQAAADGEVRRPGVYELRGSASVDDLLGLAGGMTALAYPGEATLSRINDDRARVVEDVNLNSAEGRGERLRGGDRLKVPSVLDRVDNTVELTGHVYRPATVQHRPGMRISDLIPSLERLKPLADMNYVLIRRELLPDRRIVALSADLEAALRSRGSDADIELKPRDRVTVFNRVPMLEREDAAPGADTRAPGGAVQLRVAPPRELVVVAPGSDESLPRADFPVDEEAGPRSTGERWVLSEDEGWVLLPELTEEPDEPDDTKEAERQERFKARLDSDRELVVGQLLDELRLQANYESHAPVVRIDGRVRAPGMYPLEPGMRVSDLLRAGGSLAESAYITAAEVTRYEVVNGEYREARVIPIDLAGVRAGESSADIALQPYDFLNVKEVTNWGEQESVTLKGEVRFPGTYPIRKGESLLTVIERAGGLTERAFVDGVVFTRVSLREREARQLRQLAERLEADLAALALEGIQAGGGTQNPQALATGQSMLSQLNTATPVGRLAMDFSRVLEAEPGSSADIQLENGDVLMVPGPMQTVTVLGEVQSPTSLLFDASLARDDYINLSGGTTRRADMNRIYIVRANGQVSAGGSRKWFNSMDAQVQPGDTIVVPTDVGKMRPLPLWSAVTSIIFNLAVAVAAVNSF